MAQAAPKRAMAALREHAANQHLHVHAAPHDGLPASAPAAVLAVAEQVSRAVAMRSAGASLAAASGRSSTASKASGNASLYDEDVTSLLLGLTAEERASLAGRNAPAASSEGSMPAEMATPAAALPPKPTSSPASEPDLRTSSAAAASSTPQQPYTARGSKSPRLSDKLPAAELARSLIPASIEPPAAAASSKPRAGQLANSGVQLISRTAGAGVRSASAGVRSAARFMGTPITAARRQYFPIGRHLYIFPWAVAPVAAGEKFSSYARWSCNCKGWLSHPAIEGALLCWLSFKCCSLQGIAVSHVISFDDGNVYVYKVRSICSSWGICILPACCVSITTLPLSNDKFASFTRSGHNSKAGGAVQIRPCCPRRHCRQWQRPAKQRSGQAQTRLK